MQRVAEHLGVRLPASPPHPSPRRLSEEESEKCRTIRRKTPPHDHESEAPPTNSGNCWNLSLQDRRDVNPLVDHSFLHDNPRLAQQRASQQPCPELDHTHETATAEPSQFSARLNSLHPQANDDELQAATATTARPPTPPRKLCWTRALRAAEKAGCDQLKNFGRQRRRDC